MYCYNNKTTVNQNKTNSMAKDSENERIQTLNEWGEERLMFDLYVPVIAFCKKKGVREEDPITESRFFELWKEFQVNPPKY